MFDGLRRRLAPFWDIRPNERARVGLLALYFFLVITSYYVIKPVRNSLFIQRLGADNLPYVYILTALLVGVLISFYSRFADRITRRALVMGTFAFLASNLVAFWWILGRGGLLSSGAFYIWAKLYPLLLVSQFWLVANDFFTTPQAKRVFGLIGAGGIVGGIAGSSIAGGFATLLGSERLLLVSAGTLGLCAALLVVIDRTATPVQSRPRPSRTATPPPGAWKLLKESTHLRTIAYILGLTIIVSTIVDWQFAKAVEIFIIGEDAKTAFFGRFFVILNSASVIIQFVLTSWVLRVFGVGIALLLLPIGLLTGSIGIIIHPGLWTTAFAKGAEGALRYSLDQSTRELLFLPVPPDVKYRGKPLIDLVVYRGGTGVAGIIVLVANGVFDFGLREMSILAAAMVVVWLSATVAMRREFKKSVRRLIRSRDVEARELLVQYLDAGTRTELIEALERDDEKSIVYSISLLEGIDDSEIVKRAGRLLDHSSERVRARTLKVLNEAHARDLGGASKYLPLVQGLLRDPAIAVRSQAVAFVSHFGPTPDSQAMQEFSEAGDPEVRAAALAYVSSHGNAEEAAAAVTTLLDMATQADGGSSVRERKVAAEAMALVETRAEVSQALAILLQDPEVSVQLAAIRAAARARRPELVPYLAARLCCATTRGTARAALVAHGPETYEQLGRLMLDAQVPLEVRLAIPSVFYERGDQPAADALVRVTPRLRPVLLRRSALKALNRMRRNYDGLSFPRKSLEQTLVIELRKAYQFAADRTVILPDELLGDMLTEHERRAFERASRILGMLYPQSDILAAYQGITSGDAAQRAAGYELLDSTLSIGHRRLVGPLADPELSPEERAERGATLFPRVSFGSRPDVLRRLARDKDEPWLAAVASAKGGGAMATLAATVRAPFHLHPLPQAGRPFRALLFGSDRDMVLKLVERAEFLRKVEFFSQVRAEDLAKIAAIAQEREFQRGETLFAAGDEGSELFVIVSGEVEAARSGQRVFLATAGNPVGTLTLIDAQPRELTVTALDPVVALVIDREDFFDLMRSHFSLAEGVFMHLARLVRTPKESVDPERI